MTAHIAPGKLHGAITAPPSKSMAHRMLICAALAQGGSRIDNLDYSVDISATIGALRRLGAVIECEANSAAVVGIRPGAATIESGPVDCAESGSTLRFMIPLFALAGQKIFLTGAPRLLERPLGEYQKIFAEQGLLFSVTSTKIAMDGPLHSGEFTMAGNVSSQFLSGLLFALPLLAGDSLLRITPPFESRSYLELTRNAQRRFGITSHWVDDHTLHIPGGQSYRPVNARVEGDWSQGAVPAVLAGISGNITVEGLDAASAQGDKVVLDILSRCGASVRWHMGSLLVTPPENGLVAPGDVSLADCPDLGPILCALALFCKGTTQFTHAGRLRIKESDRIATVEQELGRLGGHISSTEDTITVEGMAPLLTGQTAQSHNDHRVVMALSATALAAGLALDIDGAQAIRKSWPGFFDELRKLGAEVDML